MKLLNISATGLFILLINFVASSQPKIPTSAHKKLLTKEQQFAKQLFTSIQKNDEALWLSLHPTNEEYETLLQQMLNAKMKGITQKKIDDMIERRKKESVGAYKNELHDLQMQSAKEGVVWKNALYQNFDGDAVYPTNFPKKYLNGVIWFATKNAHYVIEDIEAVETSSGYKLQAIKGIRRVEEGD